MTRKLTASVATATLALGGVVAGAGAATADEGPVEAGITVPQVENLPEDFMNGVDISSILSLEASGVTFRDFDGQEADLFDVLADAGVNYVRVRVWNDPYDAQGNGYGGGTVDAERAAEIGRRAAEAGMKTFVDFHYADFWAHPGQQPVPKAWKDFSAAQKAEALYDYTAETLEDMVAAGVDVGMVQIGNETTSLQLSGENWPASAALFQAGSDAVRDVVPDAKIAIHFTNPESQNYLGYAKQLAEGPDGTVGTGDEIDYDVFASSYYSYWHGSTANLTSKLSAVAETYDKEVIVAETSWAYTLEDGDGSKNNVLTEYDQYTASPQGQALAVRDVIEAVANVGDAGVGVFYWEPAWLPVGPADQVEENEILWERDGSGWASSYAGEYSADAEANHGGSGWDNQALFDHEGYPLDSLRVFQYARTGSISDKELYGVTSPQVTVNDGDEVSLPSSVTVKYTDGSGEDQAVSWAFQPSWITGAGEYVATGVTSGGIEVSATITVLDPNADVTNYVVNPGFEAGAAPWTGTGNLSRTDDPHSGTRSGHFYFGNGGTATFTQTITGMPAGNYRLSAYTQGRSKQTGEDTFISATSGINTVNRQFSHEGHGIWQRPVTDLLPVAEGGSVTVTASVTVAAGGWGTIDDFALLADVPVVEADTAALAQAVAAAQGYDKADYTAVSYLALTRALQRGAFILESPAPSQAAADAATEALGAAIDGLVEGDSTVPTPTVDPVSVSVVAGQPISLPSTVTVRAYDDTLSTKAVRWNDVLDAITGPGTYTVTGTAQGKLPATATITVTAAELLANGGFENGVDDASPWTITANPWPAAEVATFWITGETPHTGDYAFQFWNNSGAAFDASVTQDLTGLAPGAYRLTAQVIGGDATGLSLVAGEESTPVVFGAWDEWVEHSVDVTVGEEGTLKVGVTGSLAQGGWGRVDDVTLTALDAVVPEPGDSTALEAALADAGAVVREGHTALSLAALDRAVEKANLVLAAEVPTQEALDAVTQAIAAAIADLATVPSLRDIAANPFATQIAWLASTGVTTGWATDTPGVAAFRPLSNVNRDQMAAFLYRMAGSPAFEDPATPTFADVPTTHVFFTEIEWLATQGITDGWTVNGVKQFRPTTAVNRDVMAAFLYRFAGSPEFDAPSASPFVDVKTDHVFYDEIAWLASTGISEGWSVEGGAAFRPTTPVKRDVMAAFLSRYDAQFGF